MNIFDYVILALVLLGIVAAVISMYRRKKSGKDCCGGCSGCCSSCKYSCNKNK